MINADEDQCPDTAGIVRGGTCETDPNVYIKRKKKKKKTLLVSDLSIPMDSFLVAGHHNQNQCPSVMSL